MVVSVLDYYLIVLYVSVCLCFIVAVSLTSLVLGWLAEGQACVCYCCYCTYDLSVISYSSEWIAFY